MKHFTVKTLAKIAILSTISFILMYMEFPLPFVPSFYKIDFSEVSVLIGGFALGPLAAFCIEGLKIILKLLFKPTTTAFVGEFANFLIGIAFAVPAAVIYAKNKTKKTAAAGMVCGTLIMTVVGVLLNYFVLLPMYSRLYGIPMDALVGMGTALIPAIRDRLTFVLLAVTPFNIIKGVIVSILTMLLYKHISPLLHR
ncbi:MAG: ECF transporter S component [Solobacterium sp.]|nr:ECF transporter S component [Solobacterium sp.]